MTSEVPTLRLKDCLSLLKDGTHNPPERSEKGIKFIAGATDIKYLHVNFSKCTFVSQENYKIMHKKWEPRVNDVLLTIVGTVGNTAIVREQDLPFTMQRSIATLRPNEKIDFRYLFYWLNSHDAKWAISSRITATGQPGIYLGELGKIPIPIPRLEVQKKISEKLYILDQAISINRKIEESLQMIIASIFRSWFIDFDPVKAKSEGKLPYGMDEETMAMFPDSFEDTDFGPIPKGWKIGMMEDVLSRKQDKITPGEHLSQRQYVPIDNIDSKSLTLKNWLPYEEAASSLILFSKNDLLFGAMRPYFHKVTIAPFDGITRSTCFVFKPKVPEAREFSLFLLNLDATIRYSTDSSLGSTMPYAIWKNGLARHKIVLPPTELMIAFSELISPFIEKIRDGGLSTRSLSSSRDSLLPRLMSGELKIN